jgi:hypothetical protein
VGWGGVGWGGVGEVVKGSTLKIAENGFLKYLCIFESRIFRLPYGSIHDNELWRTLYSKELHSPCDELDVVKAIKIGRVR